MKLDTPLIPGLIRYQPREIKDLGNASHACPKERMVAGSSFVLSHTALVAMFTLYPQSGPSPNPRGVDAQGVLGAHQTNQELCVAWRITQAMWNQDYVVRSQTLLRLFEKCAPCRNMRTLVLKSARNAVDELHATNFAYWSLRPRLVHSINLGRMRQ